MYKYGRISYILSFLAISLLLVLIAISIVLVIPAIAGSLSLMFVEYRESQQLIEVLLTIPVALIAIFLAQILILLRSVYTNSILNARSQLRVRALATTSFSIAGALVALLGWLIFMNTVPPLIGLILLVGILLTLAVSFVILVLLGLLNKATLAAEDLEGVI